MQKVLENYGISPDMPYVQKLNILEEQKQSLLRKLNAAFGRPELEKKISKELLILENVQEDLKNQPVFSMDDVDIEVRELSQTIVPKEKDEFAEIRRKETAILEDTVDGTEAYGYIIDILVYYLRNGFYSKMEPWLLYASSYEDLIIINLLIDCYTKPMFGREDPQKAFYWTKKAAELGDKDCCNKLGDYYGLRKSACYDPYEALRWYIEAADNEHIAAYLKAAALFSFLEQHDKAKICYNAALELGEKRAAFLIGAIYEREQIKNGYGKLETLVHWYEQAYQDNPDGDVCYLLGLAYVQQDSVQKGIDIFRQGVEKYNSEDCRKELMDYTTAIEN